MIEIDPKDANALVIVAALAMLAVNLLGRMLDYYVFKKPHGGLDLEPVVHAIRASVASTERIEEILASPDPETGAPRVYCTAKRVSEEVARFSRKVNGA